jgi:hypothetical protein
LNSFILAGYPTVGAKMSDINEKAKDTYENRGKVFTSKCYEEFASLATQVLAIAVDKRNGTSTHSQRAGQVIGLGGAVGGAVLAGCGIMDGGGEVATAVAAVLGAPIMGAVKKIEQGKQHKTEKDRIKFMTGFKVDDEEWKLFLTRTYLKIFQNFNLQFHYLTKECTDDWPVLMEKLAIYSVKRTFEGLANKDNKPERPEITEELITSAFLMGRSAGDDIKVKGKGMAFFTRKPEILKWNMQKLVESPAVRRADDTVINGRKGPLNKYLYRREFDHEKNMTATEILKREPISPTLDVNDFDQKFEGIELSLEDVHDKLMDQFDDIVSNIMADLNPLSEICKFLEDLRTEVDKNE